jgi:hypothetical protein
MNIAEKTRQRCNGLSQSERARLLAVGLAAIYGAASAGTISDRYPHAYVKTTPTGRILRSESNWQGHVKPVAEIAETSGQTWFLVEPSWSLPPSVVPSTNNFVRRIIVGTNTLTGLWFQGRTVTAP